MYRGWRAAIFLAPVLAAMAILPALASNDPLFNQQWGLHKIEAERAWGPGSSGSGVVVAVVDTGVNFGHEDLNGHSAGSINVIGDQRDPCTQGLGDNNGHGTEVSGVISASSGNGVGVASVAPGATILSVKALDCGGGGYVSDVADGIKQSADRGARVINLSLGPQFIDHLVSNLLDDQSREGDQSPEEHLRSAAEYAAQRNALVVAASGNDIFNSYWAGKANVLVVGASGLEDNETGYTSPGWDLLAPGGDGSCGAGRCIVTTSNNGGYVAVKGTSFAAPAVSGVAALLYARGFTNPADVRNRIISTADPVPDGRRLNAARAVDAPAPPPPTNAPDSASPGKVESQGTGSNNQPGPSPTKQATAAAQAKTAPSQSPEASVTPGAPVPGGSAGPDLSQLPVLPIGGAAGSGAAGGPDPLNEFAASGASGGKRGLKIVSAFTALGVLVGGGASFYRKRLG